VSHHLQRINNAFIDHVDVFAVRRVEPSLQVVLFLEFVNDDGAFETCVQADSLGWDLASFFHDFDADVLVKVFEVEVVESARGVEESGATTNDNAFIDSGTSSAESILDTVFQFTHFDFRSAAALDDRDTTGETAHSFLELLFVVSGFGLADSSFDIRHTLVYFSYFTVATHNNSVVFRNDHFFAAAEHVKRSVLD